MFTLFALRTLDSLLALLSLFALGTLDTLLALLTLGSLSTSRTYDSAHIYTLIIGKSQHQFPGIVHICIRNTDAVNAVFTVFAVSTVFTVGTDGFSCVYGSFI